MLVTGIQLLIAYPENHVEVWLVILFLSRKEFHAKQIFVLSSSMKLGPGGPMVQMQKKSIGPDVLTLAESFLKARSEKCQVFNEVQGSQTKHHLSLQERICRGRTSGHLLVLAF